MRPTDPATHGYGPTYGMVASTLYAPTDPDQSAERSVLPQPSSSSSSRSTAIVYEEEVALALVQFDCHTAVTRSHRHHQTKSNYGYATTATRP